ncbi:MAG: NAD(P)/FAD-dependent oxidoreductase [Acidimicrobiales bacterium]
MRTLIVGAGIAGLAAARRLLELGLEPDDLRIVDKARGVGGRMASRRIGTPAGVARFDHGAQFFTSRSETFSSVVAAAVDAGAVVEWTRGFGPDPDGHPRWRGSAGMTSLCKWLAADAGLEPLLGHRIMDLRAELADHPADAVIHTAPVPQALATLALGAMLPEPTVAQQLAEIHYKPTIAVLLAPQIDPTGLAAHGGAQYVDHPDLAFVADNRAKGISPVPAVTIHLSNERSNELWNATDDDVLTRALAWAADALGEAGDRKALVGHQIQRWRYAGPVDIHPDATVVWGNDPVVALAGEAFAGPKVEGAFLSGRAAADAVFVR